MKTKTKTAEELVPGDVYSYHPHKPSKLHFVVAIEEENEGWKKDYVLCSYLSAYEMTKSEMYLQTLRLFRNEILYLFTT
jgi:hypothetical protein